MSEKNIKSFIDELIKEVEDELDEANVTGNVDGYDTPNAFSGKNSDKKRKKTATQFGYTLVNNDINNIDESINEASLQKGKTYGGSKCEGGCFIGKEGLKKIIKISKDSPKDVFMFRDDNYSGLQPHFVKDGIIAKATTVNPAYDLEKNKVRSLNIGNDVILSVRLFVSTNESTNEAKFKSPDYIISTTPASSLPAQKLSHADVMIGLKLAEKLKNYTLNVRHYKLVHANGKVALKLTPEGKTAVRVRTEADPNYIKLIQNTINDVVADYVSKIKESVNEAKDETYFKTASDAVGYARTQAEKKGFEIDPQEWNSEITMGGRYSRTRPGVGKTNSFSVGLLKGGKPQRKNLNISLYGMESGKFELTYYIN